MATPAERAATIWATLGGQVGREFTFSQGGVSFTVLLEAVIDGSVWVIVSATTGSGQNKVNLPLEDGIAGEFEFWNPPVGLEIQAEVGHWEMGSPGQPRVWVIDVPRIVSGSGASILTAAKQMVYDAVTASARTYGWVG